LTTNAYNTPVLRILSAAGKVIKEISFTEEKRVPGVSLVYRVD